MQPNVQSTFARVERRLVGAVDADGAADARVAVARGAGCRPPPSRASSGGGPGGSDSRAAGSGASGRAAACRRSCRGRSACGDRPRRACCPAPPSPNTAGKLRDALAVAVDVERAAALPDDDARTARSRPTARWSSSSTDRAARAVGGATRSGGSARTGPAARSRATTATAMPPPAIARSTRRICVARISCTAILGECRGRCKERRAAA